ncbi:copper amine oxidase N-terminal domain-containing protein [Paenibacillus mesophilus]|uniref:copper amine oxidase N-terminal domain-containing protein n=1 Tax=Paenibacillus mesophilus TaxID=2582849 RepID=UPI0013053CE5|nr:copper amine oxidase N-terminal domain-containing protein [Paenibacillus mesophilus]
MIKKQKFGTYGKWLILVVLLVVVGCQSLGGLDLNRALLNGLDTTSLQESTSISLHFKLDPNKQPDERTKAMIELLNDAKLELQQIKMESLERMSVNGKLTLSKGSIPFHLFAKPDQIVMQIEGASQTIVLPYGLNGMAGSEEADLAINDVREQFLKKYKEKGIDKSIASFIVNNLPNPKNIQVSSTNETIHGEQLPVFKLETSLNGTEMIPLLKSFLRNMTKDDASFKQLIGQLYDVLWPIVKPHLKNEGLTDGAPYLSRAPNGFLESIIDAAEDRELAIDIIHTTLKELLFIGIIGIDSLGKAEDSSMKAILNDKTYVNTKLYFDRSFNLRKSDVDVTISPQVADNGGIAAVQLKLQSENWDRNKAVAADELKTGPKSLIFGKDSTRYELAEIVDPASLLGQLLGTQLSQPEEEDVFYIPVENKDAKDLTGAYLEDETPYAPLWLLADYLYADVQQDGDKVTLTDEWGTVIKLTVGSKEADVDGELFEMEGTVRVHNDVVYVPCLSVAEWLGAYAWYDEEENVIGISLDY